MYILCYPEFCVQSERHEDIAEALSLLKESNPLWQPKYFMTDYSEAEMLAIEQVTAQTSPLSSTRCIFSAYFNSKHVF